MPLPPFVEKLLEEEAIAIATRIASAAESEAPVLVQQFSERLSHILDRVSEATAAKIKVLLAPKPAPAAQSPAPVPPVAAAAAAPASAPTAK